MGVTIPESIIYFPYMCIYTHTRERERERCYDVFGSMTIGYPLYQNQNQTIGYPTSISRPIYYRLSHL